MSICIWVSRHSGPLLDERGVNCRAVFISKFDWAAHHLLGLNSALYARWCPQVVNTCNCENNYWNCSLNLLLDSSQSSLEQSLLWNFPSCQIHRFKLLKFTKCWNTCNQSVKGNIIPKYNCTKGFGISGYASKSSDFWSCWKWCVSRASWKLRLEIHSHKTTWQTLFVYLSIFGVFGSPVQTTTGAFSRNLDWLDLLQKIKFEFELGTWISNSWNFCMVGGLYVCVYFRSSSKGIYSQWA